MTTDFKQFIKSEGRTLKWFYNVFEVHQKTGLTYSGFTAQLNGYAPLSDVLRNLIFKYIHNEEKI